MVAETVDGVKLHAGDVVNPTGEILADGFRLEFVDMRADHGVPVSTSRFAERKRSLSGIEGRVL